MSSNLKQSQANFVLKSRVALTNVETQPEIAAEMAELGYDSAKIAEGKTLVQKAEEAIGTQQREKHEEGAAGRAFKKVKKEVDALFRNHRKKCLFAFMDEPEVLDELRINRPPSVPFGDWRDEVNHFYNTLSGNAAYLSAVAGVRLKAEEINAAKGLLPAMDKAYSDYYRESGESEESTRAKNAAVRELQTYMTRFWKAAHIALEDAPQLQEALMKGVRS